MPSINYYDSTQSSLDGYNRTTNSNNMVKRVGGAFKGFAGSIDADLDQVSIGNISGVYGNPPSITTTVVDSTGGIGDAITYVFNTSGVNAPDSLMMLKDITMKSLETSDLHELNVVREPIATGLIRDSYGIWRNSDGNAVTLTAVSGSVERIGGGGDSATPAVRASGFYNVRVGGATSRPPIEARRQ